MAESCFVYTHRDDSVVCWNHDVSRVCLQRACGHVLDEISVLACDDGAVTAPSERNGYLRTAGQHHGKDELRDDVGVLATTDFSSQAFRSVLSRRSAR